MSSILERFPTQLFVYIGTFLPLTTKCSKLYSLNRTINQTINQSVNQFFKSDIVRLNIQHHEDQIAVSRSIEQSKYLPYASHVVARFDEIHLLSNDQSNEQPNEQSNDQSVIDTTSLSRNEPSTQSAQQARCLMDALRSAMINNSIKSVYLVESKRDSDSVTSNLVEWLDQSTNQSDTPSNFQDAQHSSIPSISRSVSQPLGRSIESNQLQWLHLSTRNFFSSVPINLSNQQSINHSNNPWHPLSKCTSLKVFKVDLGKNDQLIHQSNNQSVNQSLIIGLSNLISSLPDSLQHIETNQSVEESVHRSINQMLWCRELVKSDRWPNLKIFNISGISCFLDCSLDQLIGGVAAQSTDGSIERLIDGSTDGWIDCLIDPIMQSTSHSREIEILRLSLEPSINYSSSESTHQLINQILGVSVNYRSNIQSVNQSLEVPMLFRYDYLVLLDLTLESSLVSQLNCLSINQPNNRSNKQDSHQCLSNLRSFSLLLWSDNSIVRTNNGEDNPSNNQSVDCSPIFDFMSGRSINHFELSSLDQSINQSIIGSVNQYLFCSSDRSARHSFDRSISQSLVKLAIDVGSYEDEGRVRLFDHPVRQLNNQSINQSISQSIHQSIQFVSLHTLLLESVDCSIDLARDETIDQSINCLINWLHGLPNLMDLCLIDCLIGPELIPVIMSINKSNVNRSIRQSIKRIRLWDSLSAPRPRYEIKSWNRINQSISRSVNSSLNHVADRSITSSIIRDQSNQLINQSINQLFPNLFTLEITYEMDENVFYRLIDCLMGCSNLSHVRFVFRVYYFDAGLSILANVMQAANDSPPPITPLSRIELARRMQSLCRVSSLQSVHHLVVRDFTPDNTQLPELLSLLFDQSDDRPADPSIIQTNNQSINRSVRQHAKFYETRRTMLEPFPFNQPVNRSTQQSIDHSINQLSDDRLIAGMFSFDSDADMLWPEHAEYDREYFVMKNKNELINELQEVIDHTTRTTYSHRQDS